VESKKGGYDMFDKLKSMVKDTGAVGMEIHELVELCVGLIVIAALVPTALSMFYSADVSAVLREHAGLGNLWSLIPLMVILAIAISVIYDAMQKTKIK
jgi:hypothetical protein